MTKPHKQNPMAGELAPPPERQFYSIAFLVTMLQQTPEFVFSLMKASEVNFAYTQNGVGWIRGDDVQKMEAMLDDAKTEATAYARN